MTAPYPDSKLIKTVWVVSDGIPGHFNQSKGILLALEQLYSLKIEWIELRLKSGIYRRLLSWLLNHSLVNRTRPSLGLLSFFYRGQLPSDKPDMVIGAGGKSAFAVAWLGQAYNASTIFAGSLRRLKPELFRAVLILEPSTQAPFITLQTSPMPISQALLKQAAEVWLAEHDLPEKPLWAMLLGGNGAGASYQDSDWQALALQMNALAAQHHIQWLVTSSRRTGSGAEQILRQYLDPACVADAVWWSATPRPVTSSYLGLSKVICCTVDSMSMIMESVSAMRPVVAVKPRQFMPDSNFQNAMDRLQQQRLILQADITSLSGKIGLIAQLKPFDEEPIKNLISMLQIKLE